MFIIQLLFKTPVKIPKKEKMEAIMQKHLEDSECVSYSESLACFPAKKIQGRI